MKRPINQRIEFLLEALSISARDFSRAVGVPDNNTQNYLEPRFAQPKADYLEKVMLHFESINPVWLLTGKGEPFLPDAKASTTSSSRIKSDSGVGVGHGGTNKFTNNLTTHDCQRELENAQKEMASLRRELELQAALLASKEETITLLRASYNRPN